MRLILTHDQADLDAIASLMAAKLLDPEAYAVLPKALNLDVQAFLSLYGRELNFSTLNDLPNETAESVLLVDTQSMATLKPVTAATLVRVIDHHPRKNLLKPEWQVEISNTGACTTLLLREIRQKSIPLSLIEATLLLLGIYEDTGSLTYTTTTPEDVYAAAWLLENRADLNLVAKFLETPLSTSQKNLFDRLLKTTETVIIEGKTLLLARADAQDMQDEISTVAHSLRDFFAGDGLILLISTRQGVRIVGRSSTDEVDVAKLARKYGGGGHLRAASALVHQARHASAESVNLLLDELYLQIREYLPEIVTRGVMIADIMSQSPLVLEPEKPVAEIQELMIRYGFEGFPVVEAGRVIGLVNRRSVDRAIAHKLPTDAQSLMNAGNVSIETTARLSDLKVLMTESGWGQIPVTKNGKIVGIVTRTDLMNAARELEVGRIQPNLARMLEERLPASRLALLRLLAKEANEMSLPIYIVGGFVRDLILHQPSLDFDVVVEGDAIIFAQLLARKYGGHAVKHETFGTAKWSIAEVRANILRDLEGDNFFTAADLPESVDLISARNEYYKQPAALPTVQPADIKLDLRRRDFTINTLAVRLDGEHFGKFQDYWGGYEDLNDGLIRVLHALSFVDDATRILRAVRFATRFGFEIEPRTLELLKEGRRHLREITPARLRNELDLVFAEADPAEILLRLQQLGVLEAIHPGLGLTVEAEAALTALHHENPSPDWEVQVPASNHLNLRQTLGYIFWLGKLKQPNPYTFHAILNLPTWLETAILAYRELNREAEFLLNTKPSKVTGRLDATPALAVYAAYLSSPNLAFREQLKRYTTEYRQVKPHIGGKALIAAGLTPSADFSTILKKLRDARLDGEIQTDAEEEVYFKALLKAK
jgi:tRNA nucleotidyltransferase (CCA-adding enzyme)